MLAKRLFIGSSIFFVALLVLWGVYALLFRDASTNPDNSSAGSENVPNQTETPEISQKTVIQPVVKSPVLSPGLSGDGKTAYYIDKRTGHLHGVDTETGSITVFVEYDLPSAITATWPTRGTQAILKSQDTYGPVFWLYDIRSSEPIQLKFGMRYVVWDALSDRILYSYEDGEGNVSLTISDSNGSNWREIANLPSPSLRLSAIPQSPFISYWDTPLNTKINPLEAVSITGGDKKRISEGKYGADYLWSPKGDTALMSWTPQKSGSKLTLATITANGSEYTDLNFPTMVSKCVWSNDNITIYCAHPGSFPSGTVLPDDYAKKYVYTKDAFWKINTKTGETERIIELTEIDKEYDATNLFLSGNESKLFFVNRKDDMLYSIEL